MSRSTWRVLVAAVVAAVAATAIPGTAAADARQPSSGGNDHAVRQFDVQAHRGGLAWRPESTLSSFANGLEIGVSTLEMDVQITQDGRDVITHDRKVDGTKCKDTAPATPNDPEFPYVGKFVNTLTFAQVETLDCGSFTLPQFPGQRPSPGARMPTLRQVFDLVERYHADDVKLNIEDKVEAAPQETAPSEQFVQVTAAEIRKAGFLKRVTIQSFDWGTLMRMRQVEPRLPLVALTEPGFLQVGQPGKSVWLGGLDIDDFGGSPVRAAKSFGAAALSPVHGNPQGGTVNDPNYVPFTTKALVDEAHAAGVKVIPWTIDDPATINKLIDDGVDGLITDYPDRLREVLAARGLPLPTSYRDQGPNPRLRVATFNASLNRPVAGGLVADLSTGANAQARAVAEIIQRVRPDVLLINEFDFDAAGMAARLFQRNYLSVSQHGAAPIGYEYRFVAPSNTGIPSGFDLDNNGTVGGGNDALGFGDFPGQFGMVVYSRFPIQRSRARTFQRFLWKDMPGARLPDDPATAAPGDWYSPQELRVLRLSSKSHWDLPIEVGHKTIHLLASHPTPPVFDGPEDRNGTRNFDEIRLWADYVTPGRGGYIYDDRGRRGGLDPDASFVIVGDQNSDPLDGDSIAGSMQQLLENPRVNTSLTPSSLGGPEQAALQGGANLTHRTDPRFNTADFADTSPGNLRSDYVLPSSQVRITDAAVFWPRSDDPLFRLVGTFPFPTSDHRLVWADTLLSESGRSD